MVLLRFEPLPLKIRGLNLRELTTRYTSQAMSRGLRRGRHDLGSHRRGLRGATDTGQSWLIVCLLMLFAVRRSPFAVRRSPFAA